MPLTSRSAGAMRDPRARAHFLQLAGQEISRRLVDQMQQWAHDEIAHQDAERLQAKGLLESFTRT